MQLLSDEGITVTSECTYNLNSAATRTTEPAAPLDRLYMTSELRAATGLTRSHLDFYLREGIVQPTARTGSGYLLFHANELEQLKRIVAWRQEGLGIRDIRARLGREESP